MVRLFYNLLQSIGAGNIDAHGRPFQASLYTAQSVSRKQHGPPGVGNGRPLVPSPISKACSCLPDNHCTGISAASEFRESRTADPLLRNSSIRYGGLISTPPDDYRTAVSATSKFRRSRAAEASRPEASRPLFLFRSRGSMLAPNCGVARLPKMDPRPAASVPPRETKNAAIRP